MYNAENSRDPQYDVFQAASIGDSQFVKQYLASNSPNVIKDGNDGWTPLMYACHYGHFGVVRMLLEAGAETDVSERSSGRTALMLASANGHTRCIEFLVNIGEANVKQTDQCGNTAATYAQQNGHGGNKLISEALGIQNQSGGSRRTPRPRDSNRRPEKQKKLNPNCSAFTPMRDLHNGQKLISSPFDIASLFEPHSTREYPRASTPGQANNYSGSSIESSLRSPRNLSMNDYQLELSSSPNASLHTFNDHGGSTFSCLPDHVPETTQEVLQQLGLWQYQEAFDKNFIDLGVFQSMSDKELVEIGVTPLGHRLKLKAAQQLIRNSLNASNLQDKILLNYYFTQEKDNQQAQIDALQAEIQSLKQQFSNFKAFNFNHTVTHVT